MVVGVEDASSLYRVFVGDTITGNIIVDLPVSDQKWGIRLNDCGPIDATVPLNSKEALRINMRLVTEPIRMFMGVSYGDRILEAGPIWQRSYSPGDDTMKVNALGMWSIFDHRKALQGLMLKPGAAVTRSAIKLKNLSLGSIARELVRISLKDNPYPGGDLNIVLPPVVAGTAERNYLGYDLGWIGDRLRQITGVQNGPDLRFQPRFAAGGTSRVEWVLATGNPLLQQAGADWIWDAKAGKSGVIGLGVDQDGTQLASKAWTPGSGQDVDMILKSAMDVKLLNTGYPWTETDQASKDVEDPNLVQSYADRLLQDSLRPWETWSLTADAQNPTLGQYLPGDWARIFVPRGHPIIPFGEVRARIMAIDGDDSQTVKIELAPIQAEIPIGDARGDTITTIVPSKNLLYPNTDVFPSRDLYPLGVDNGFTILE